MIIKYFNKFKEFTSASKFNFIFIIISILISTITIVLLPTYITSIIDMFLLHKGIEEQWKPFLIILFLLLLHDLSSQFENINNIKITEEIINNIRIKLFRTIELMPESYFKNSSTSEHLNKFIKDIKDIRDTIKNSGISLIKRSCLLIFVICAISLISIKLTLSAFCLSPFIIFAIIFLENRKSANANLEKTKDNEYHEFIENTILNIKTIKANALEKDTRLKFHNLNIKNNKESISYRAINNTIKSIQIGLILIIIAINFIIGSQQILQDNISIGELVAIFIYIDIAYNSIFLIIKSYFNINGNYNSLNKVLDSLDIRRLEKNIIDSLDGDIIFNHVEYEYNKKVFLNNISFNIGKGSKVLFLGDDSSYKDYIMDLLEGGNYPFIGEIKVNNNIYSPIKINYIKNKIGRLYKDAVLFSGTIFENLIYGCKTTTKEAVDKVCKDIGLYDAVMALGEGFETEIAPGSLVLNKGEYILLNIARLILINPDVIILEESNHNLDSTMEGKINIATNILCTGKTTIYLSSKVNPNSSLNIYIVNKGEIIDEGTYTELSGKESNKKILGIN